MLRALFFAVLRLNLAYFGGQLNFGPTSEMERTFPPEIWGEIFLWIDLGSFWALSLVCRAFRCKLLKLRNRLISGWQTTITDDQVITTILPNKLKHGPETNREFIQWGDTKIECIKMNIFGKIAYDYLIDRKIPPILIDLTAIKKKQTRIKIWNEGYDPAYLEFHEKKYKWVSIDVRVEDFVKLTGIPIMDKPENVHGRLYDFIKNHTLHTYFTYFYNSNAPVRIRKFGTFFYVQKNGKLTCQNMNLYGKSYEEKLTIMADITSNKKIMNIIRQNHDNMIIRNMYQYNFMFDAEGV